MKIFFLCFGFIACIYGLYGYKMGYKAAKDEIPSCIYIQRPKNNDIKPWGYDGKEGVDMPSSKIQGGGIYVSLEDFK